MGSRFLESKPLCDVSYKVLHVGDDAARRKRPAVGELVDGEFGNVHAVEVHLADGSVVKHAVGRGHSARGDGA